MAIKQDPGMYKRRVRLELRQARRKAGLTQQDAAAALDASPSKIIRIESGFSTVSTPDLRALLAAYGVHDVEATDRLVEMARLSRGRPWWHEYHEIVRQDLPQLLAFENEASVIRTYSPTVITALLQTPDYAWHVRRPSFKNEGHLSKMVELIGKRQEILTAPEAPQVSFIIDETALRRLVGGETVMLGQLRHLLAVAELPNVTLQIFPFSRGANASLGGPFVLLEFPDDDDDVVFLEGARGDTISRDDRELISEYAGIFADLIDASLSTEASIVFLNGMIKTLERNDGVNS